MAFTYRQAIWLTSNGCVALAVFGGLWWGLALTTPIFSRLQPWTGIGVAIGAVMLLVAALRLRRKASGLTRSELSESQRTLAARMARGYWLTVAAEVVLVSAVWVLSSSPGLAWPLTGLIVSLHFLPLAKVFDRKIYYATGVAGLVLSALALGDAFGRPITILSAGMGIVLWATVLYLLASAESFARANESLLQKTV